MNKHTSIAILGGGVSGLVLARSLAELGYERIVVFERAAEVGGKCCTIDVDARPHDLGATMGVPIDYRPVTRVSRELGIANPPFPPEQHFSLERGGPVALNTWREMPAVVAQAAKYMTLHLGSWQGTDGSGLHRADPALYRPWSELVQRHGLDAVSRRTLCYRAGYGYGYDDEVPAAMYANLFRPQTFLGLGVSRAFMWDGGTQPIWTSLARQLGSRIDIRTATSVTKIERTGSNVIVSSRGPDGRQRVERFDRLVLTFNPKDALGILDASAGEERWFSQVRTYPYATFACEVSGLASDRASIGYIDENMVRERAGHPMAWVKRYADQDIYVFHLFAPDAMPDAEIARRIGDDVARLGGRLERVRAARRWQFFPHFTSEMMQSGGLSEIDRWQGQSGVYLIGEVLSFATMARVAGLAVDFATRIVRDRASRANATTVVVPPLRAAS